MHILGVNVIERVIFVPFFNVQGSLSHGSTSTIEATPMHLPTRRNNNNMIVLTDIWRPSESVYSSLPKPMILQFFVYLWTSFPLFSKIFIFFNSKITVFMSLIEKNAGLFSHELFLPFMTQ